MCPQKQSNQILSLLALALFVVLAPSQSLAKGQSSSKAELYYLNEFLIPVALVDGATSKVTRTYSGISVQVRTRDLTPGDAYTLWLLVFNFPENCASNPCTLIDVENQAVVSDTMYVAGNVVGRSGRAAFAGHKAIGDNSGSILPPLLPEGIQPPGLLNPMGAEIHLLVHTHGPMLPEYMPDMIHTFSGGCVNPGFPFNNPSLWFPEWGARGPNTCASQQGTAHLPE